MRMVLLDILLQGRELIPVISKAFGRAADVRSGSFRDIPQYPRQVRSRSNSRRSEGIVASTFQGVLGGRVTT